MKWYEDYEWLLDQFENNPESVDETQFYFSSEAINDTHYIGYISKYEDPYWAGYCDVPDGCAFHTAKELFEAKIYDGKSIKERWGEVVLTHFGGIDVEVVDSWI